MTDYYVDPSKTGGDNDGGGDGVANDSTDEDNWTHAWVSMQSAADAVGAGDVVYCRGTQTLTTAGNGISFTTSVKGDTTSGFTKFIGVNSSGVNDGTRFVLDGGDSDKPVSCILASNIDYTWFENIECQKASGSGVDDGLSISIGVIFFNCAFHHNGSNGFDGYRFQGGRMILCTFYNNGLNGLFQGTTGFSLFFCSIHDNDASGIEADYLGGTIMGNLIYDNGAMGINDYGGLGLNIINNVINGNTDDGLEAFGSSYPAALIISNRITNHPTGKYGLDCNSLLTTHGWNYFEGNAAGNIVNDSLAQEILYNSSPTNIEDQSDADQGYTNLNEGSENFNLTDDATLRRTAITIPLT